MSRPPVVVKVGGSLLDWSNFPSRLRDFLGSLREERVVLVVGGGRIADEIRRLDQAHHLGEEVSHRLALRALDLTAQILASLLEEVQVVRSLAELAPVWATGRIPALAPREFLEEDDRLIDPLPHTWDVTTDSIAARLAARLGAERLVLLKSRHSPGPGGLDVAARLGYVDDEFPRAVRGLRSVEARNLRAEDDVGRIWDLTLDEGELPFNASSIDTGSERDPCG